MHKSLPVEQQFHFICILNFYSLCKFRTRCIQNSRLNHSPCTQAKQACTVLCLCLVSFFYLQFFVWCISFADLPRYGSLKAIFCKSHPTYDSRVFRMSSYFNQLKIKVILEYDRNFNFVKHLVEFLGGGGRGGGGGGTTLAFQEMQSAFTSYILKTSSAS